MHTSEMIIFDLAKFSKLRNKPLSFCLCTCKRIQVSLIKSQHVWGNQTARLNSPASSAHTAPCQTYAAPWHVQRGQTVAEAWVAEPALWWAYPGPVAILVWARLKDDEKEMQKKKNGGKKTSHIQIESREWNWIRKKANLRHCIVLSSRVWKTNSQGSQTGQPAVGTINRSMGVTAGHSQRSTDSRPSSWTHSSHLGHSPLLPLRNLNGSIQ